ncbi:MAG: GNAT family N-acetyltransferase [Rhodospirillales bacterium]|nr:GNAT family N-acetyltransferase [Rhodospirillales bacterium]
MSGPGFSLRPAALADTGALLSLIRALAEYERLLHEVRATEADLRAALFGKPARAGALLAEAGGKAVGFALWYYTYSTFTGRPGLYLEDIYVEPAHRGRGIGRAIFRHLAHRAEADGCTRLEWSVLDWNAPAQRFYAGLGAEPMSEWTVHRLEGPALAALAG